MPDTLLTYSECIIYIPSLSDASQATVQAYIDVATRTVESYCNREFLSKTVSERYVILQNQRIYLKVTPVTNVSRVVMYQQSDPILADSCGYVSGYNSTETNMTECKVDINLEYVLESRSGVMTFVNTFLPYYRKQMSPSGSQYSYIVDYTGGFDVCPNPVKLAIAQLVDSMYSSTKYDNSLQSEKIGDYSYSRSSLDPFLSTKSPVAHLLAPYVRYGVNGL